MKSLETLLDPLAWTLLHFLWQGALVALAAALALAALRGRGARVRYLTACAGLATMAVLPPATAFYLGADATLAASSAAAPATDAAPVESVATPAAVRDPSFPPAARFEASSTWLVAVWLAGVAALSLAHLGGWRRVRRLRRDTRPAAERWTAAVERLAGRLGIARPVRLLESAALRVPVVVGWLRPAILVPASAFAGLAPHQLEAVLAHELAHVRRHDFLVNLVQVALETLLFYHPAVWWLSKQVRVERENCCDDLAVEVCGNAAAYARALAELEGLRFGAPAFALGADGGSLLARVRRLLGRGDEPPADGWLSAAVAALAAALVAAAGATLLVLASSSDAAPAPETPADAEEAPSWAEGWLGAKEGPSWTEGWWSADAGESPAWAEGWSADAEESPSWAVSWASEDAAFELAQMAEEEPAEETDRRRVRRHQLEDDVDDLRRGAAGTAYEARLSEDDFREMARHGCDEDLLPSLAGAGVTGAGADDLVRLCRHGVDGDDLREYAEAGFDVAAFDDVLSLARHGVDGDDVRELRDAGYELSAEEIVKLARHGVDGDDVRGFREAGYEHLAVDDLVKLARHGVDGDDVEELAAAGYQSLTVDDLIDLARYGVDGDEAEEFVKAGYKNLSVDDLIELARHGVDGDEAEEFAEAGYPALSVDQLVELARHGVDGDELEELREAGHDLSIDEVLRLARDGELHEMTDRYDD